MSHNVILRRIRPHLFTGFRRCQRDLPSRTFASTKRASKHDKSVRDETNDYKRRVLELEEVYDGALTACYPRLGTGSDERASVNEFRTKYEYLKPDETIDDAEVALAGRIISVRRAGSKLAFLDLKQGESIVQVICDSNKLPPQGNGSISDSFKQFTRIARKGDWYQIRGCPHRSARGELSILATKLPDLLSPSLHQIPSTLDDPETRARNRHVDMIVDAAAIQILKVRHTIDRCLNDFFNDDGFTKVQTPILTSGAGGAIARPFETVATELEAQKLNLRIAPELWLKRLVVGGIDKVYEIGPAFRNEGVDATHNPEFYTCEFYQAFATLNDLMSKTERLLQYISKAVEKVKVVEWQAIETRQVELFTAPFQRLEFIPTLERELGVMLPDLATRTDVAQAELLKIFDSKDISIPAKSTLPRLLDALASHYIEPLCLQPTFITHHPACMSPLSLHFICPTTGQIVAARAELFIQSREYANMYEEENSPFAQRRKFLEQIKYREVDGEGDGKADVDESYLEALEWGLPPTGGWGCGMERLVMLFGGRDRIADVLPFGTLRNVVGLGRL